MKHEMIHFHLMITPLRTSEGNDETSRFESIPTFKSSTVTGLQLCSKACHATQNGGRKDQDERMRYVHKWSPQGPLFFLASSFFHRFRGLSFCPLLVRLFVRLLLLKAPEGKADPPLERSNEEEKNTNRWIDENLKFLPHLLLDTFWKVESSSWTSYFHVAGHSLEWNACECAGLSWKCRQSTPYELTSNERIAWVQNMFHPWR